MPAPQGPQADPTPSAMSAKGAAAPSASGASAAATGRTNGRARTSTEPRADGRFALPRLTLRRSAASSSPALDPDPAPIDADGDGSDADWRAVGLFATGLVLGSLIGAGAALLLAPASGYETRTRLVRRARLAREGAGDRVELLGDRVRRSARKSRRTLERKLAMSRWRAQDAWERKRYGE